MTGEYTFSLAASTAPSSVSGRESSNNYACNFPESTGTSTSSVSGDNPMMPGPPPLLDYTSIQGKEICGNRFSRRATTTSSKESDKKLWGSSVRNGAKELCETHSTAAAMTLPSASATLSSPLRDRVAKQGAASAAPGGQHPVVVGAVGVYASGMVVQQRPAILAPQPQMTSTEELYIPPPLSQEAPPRQELSILSCSQSPALPDCSPDQVLDNKDNEGKNDELPYYRKRKCIILAAVLVLVMVLVIAIGVSLRGGEDKEPMVIAPTMTPVAVSPTMEPGSTEAWDIQRRDISSFFIVESFQLTDRAILEDFQTPQFHAWNWLVNQDNKKWSVLTDEPAEDMDPDTVRVMMNRYVLAVVFFALDGGNWEYPAMDAAPVVKWLESEQSHCDWAFVLCDDRASNDVVELDSGGQPGADIAGGAVNMRGNLPSEIQFWTSLTSLRLPGNHISNVEALGQKSDAYEIFSNLTVLDLAGNPLDDVTPIFRLPSIATLSLQNCGMSGPLPLEFETMSSLVSFTLADNEITGTITSTGLSMIQTMMIQNNHIQGNIMDVLQSHETSLENVLADNNLLEGSLTAFIGNFTSLSILSLQKNPGLTGSLPTELGELTRLKALSLGDCLGLSGTLPTEMGNLVLMEELNLQYTDLSGTIPPEWSGMISLQKLDLHSTLVTGTVPESFCSLDALSTIVSASGMDCAGCSKCY